MARSFTGQCEPILNVGAREMGTGIGELSEPYRRYRWSSKRLSRAPVFLGVLGVVGEKLFNRL